MTVERELEAALLGLELPLGDGASGRGKGRRAEEHHDLRTTDSSSRTIAVRPGASEERQARDEGKEEQRARHVSIETPTAASCRRRLRYADERT